MRPGFLDLIAPLTLEQAARHLQAREIAFERGPASRFDGLLAWPGLRAAIESGAFPRDRLQVLRGGRGLPPLLYADGDGVSASRLDALLDGGISLAAEPIDPYFPALAGLCAETAALTGERVKAAAMVTTGEGGAYPLHFDPGDLVVLQIEGTKRWLVHGPPAEHPIHGMTPPEPPSGTAPVFDRLLEPGDMLLLPAGYWHRCENGPGLSLHLGIILQAPAAWHALENLTARLLDDPLFRVPLTRFATPEARDAHRQALHRRLAEEIQGLPFGD